MKIIKMHLENFQGIKNFTLTPDGKNLSVYGDNAAGKTTIYNAFTWLMYGKSSTGEKNYTPKTVDTHNLNHIAELVLELEDGSRINLKKDFHEVYKTVRGSAEPIFSGHTVDHFVDGVPVSESIYKKTLSGIYKSEDIAKMLTSFSYFAEDMKPLERRKILLDICGGVDFDTVVASDPELHDLPKILRKQGSESAMYTVDEYMAIASKKKSGIDKDLRLIPGRIDEANRAKPELSGKSIGELEKQLEEALQKRRELENEKRSSSEESAGNSIRVEISKLELDLMKERGKHAASEKAKNADLMKEIENLKTEIADTSIACSEIKRDIEKCDYLIRTMEEDREVLLKRWKEVNDSVYDGSDICPVCGQILPDDKIAEARSAFNLSKSKELEAISRKGKNCSKVEIAKEMDSRDAHREKLAFMNEKNEKLASRIEELSNMFIKPVAFEETDTYKDLTSQIRDLQRKLEDSASLKFEADSKINAQILECAQKEAYIREEMAQIRIFKAQEARIEELELQEKTLAAEYEEIQYGIHLCEVYTRTMARLLDEKVNSRFKTLRFRLFIEQQNGGIADDCEPMIPCRYGLVPFKSANNSARINAGLEIVETLADFYGVHLPVFVDNAESVTKMNVPDGMQVIRLIVFGLAKELRVEEDK